MFPGWVGEWWDWLWLRELLSGVKEKRVRGPMQLGLKMDLLFVFASFLFSIGGWIVVVRRGGRGDWMNNVGWDDV